MKSNRFLFIILSLLLFWACDNGHEEDKDVKRRTLIVYMAMDDAGSLSSMMSRIKDIWINSWDAAGYNGNLLIYADNGTTSALFNVIRKKGKNVAEVVQQYDGVNSADPTFFNNLLTEIANEWTAESYGLVVSSHATGWLPKGRMISPATVFKDESSNAAEMDIAAFADAIPYKMDFIIFDACLMGGVEVAYELKDKTDYLLFSPAEVISNGMIFPTTFAHLMKDAPDLEAVGREFYDYYNSLSGSWRSATVSLIKTSELDSLADISRNILYGADVENEVNLSSIQSYGYGGNLLYFDFGDMIKKFAPQSYDEFIEILDAAVIYKANTPGYFSSGSAYSEINHYSGLSVYIPQACFPILNMAHENMKWTRFINNSSVVSSN
ncbi:MAG: hypothetical protein LBM07_03195 [Culturomica sp.]|jgi:hypothetical protein|nr:hypothetical protein [Culturomica sp.]